MMLCISNCDSDMWEGLYGNIVSAGGSTMFPGIAERMAKELAARVPSSMNVRVVAVPDRIHAAWIGGSILASLSTFNEWISKAEYEEAGSSIVHRKCNT